MRIAILLTVYNRKEKTLICLDSLKNSVAQRNGNSIIIDVYLTDDASTDGTLIAIGEKGYDFNIQLLS